MLHQQKKFELFKEKTKNSEDERREKYYLLSKQGHDATKR